MSEDIQQQLLNSIARDPRISMRLIRKLRSAGKPVPDILLNSIISHELLGGDFAQELAEEYVLNHEKVPQILLDKVSESGKNSFYLAKYYAFHDQQIPDQLLKSIKKSNFADLPLREKDWDSEDEETSPQKEFIKTFYEKILKNGLMSLTYAQRLIENNREVPQELEDAILDYGNLIVEYAITLFKYKKPLSNKLLERISNNMMISYNFAIESLSTGKMIPESIFKTLLSSSDYSTDYAISYMKTFFHHGSPDKNILKRLEKGILSTSYNDPQKVEENAGNYTIVYTRIMREAPTPEIIAHSKPQNLVLAALNLLSINKNVPVEMIEKISTRDASSMIFVKQYAAQYGRKKLPEIFKKIKASADRYKAEHI